MLFDWLKKVKERLPNSPPTMNLTSDMSSLLNMAAFLSRTVALLACQLGSAVSMALDAATAAKCQLVPAEHTYDPLPLVGVAEMAATAAAAELEGRQKAVGLPEIPPALPAPPPLLLPLLLRAPGEANGEDGALIGCVIWIL